MNWDRGVLFWILAPIAILYGLAWAIAAAVDSTLRRWGVL